MRLPVVIGLHIVGAIAGAFLLGLVCANWLSSLLALLILAGVAYGRGWMLPPTR